MANVERYPGKRSEYGGGDGDPQRLPDGASLDLPGIASATGVRARIMRQAGIADFDPARGDLVGAANTGLDLSNLSAAQLEAYQKDLKLSVERAARRAEIDAKTNGYASEPESYVGESGEGSGVAL